MRPLPKDTFEVSLTPDDVAFFREHGYLAIERVTTEAEVEWLREVYDELFSARDHVDWDLSRPVGAYGEGDLPQILDPEALQSALRDTVYVRNARRIARQLSGASDADLAPFGHMILKPAGHGAETPWHQDEAYFPAGKAYDGLSVWMPVDDATVDNGCMQFVPGSHRGDVVGHRHINDDPLVHGLVTDDVDSTLAVACPTLAGGATVHHCRTIHYAGPNRTPASRRVYIQTFTVPVADRPGEPERSWLTAHNAALAERDR